MDGMEREKGRERQKLIAWESREGNQELTGSHTLMGQSNAVDRAWAECAEGWAVHNTRL